MGSRAAGAIQDLPWDPAVLAGPHPPNLDTPLLVAPESLVWTLRFLLVRVHNRLLAMRQRILGSHTPPCHRRMVITT